MRLSLAAFGLLLVGNATSSATPPPLNKASPEAVTAVAGGAAVPVVEKMNAAYRSNAGPCGGRDANYSSAPPEPPARRDPDPAEKTPYLGFYIGGGAIGLVAVAFAGWLLLRRRGA
jgi:hypothetical protein